MYIELNMMKEEMKKFHMEKKEKEEGLSNVCQNNFNYTESS